MRKELNEFELDIVAGGTGRRQVTLLSQMESNSNPEELGKALAQSFIRRGYVDVTYEYTGTIGNYLVSVYGRDGR